MVTVASEQSTIVSPPTTDGAIPWMSPELLYPEKFCLENNYPTVQSDCYALGMVIYEVLSGRGPFAVYRDPEVIIMVLGGERPERPRGDTGKLFTDEIWRVLELCWKQQPSDRPGVKQILLCLDEKPALWPPPDTDVDEEEDTNVGQLTTNTESEPGTESVFGTENGLGTQSGPGTLSLPHFKLAIDPARVLIGPSTASSNDDETSWRKRILKGGRVGDVLKKLRLRR